MKPTIKIAFVFNNTNWSSIAEKVKYVVDFFSSDFEIIPTIHHVNFTNIPFVQVSTIGGISNTPGTTNTVDKSWFSTNICSLAPDADIVLFYVDKASIPPMQTSVGIMQGKYISYGPMQACIFGINENDNVYQSVNGQEVMQGNSCAVFMAHEVSHALYLIQNQPDNTHTYFYSGQASKVLEDLKDGKLSKLFQMLAYLKQVVLLLTTQINQNIIKPATVPTPVPVPVTQPKYLWNTVENARRSVRVIADEEGLDVEQKNTMCGTIGGESGWMSYFLEGSKKGEPVKHENFVIRNGVKILYSTDWGICQWNDYYHNKEITKDESLNNPEKAVRLMCAYWKRGERDTWIAYKNGSYKNHM